MQVPTIPRHSYTITASTTGNVCTVDGTVIASFTAGEQCTFTAPGYLVIVSDEAAIVTETFKSAPVGSAAAGGSGEGSGLTSTQLALLNGSAQKSGNNSFTGLNTFSGDVNCGAVLNIQEGGQLLMHSGSTLDMSQATVVPPSGWNVTGLTDEQQNLLNGAALLTGSNAFTGSVDLSAATVTPPSDWLLVDNVYSSGMPSVLETAHIYDLGELAADADLSAVAFAVNSTAVQTCELWLSCGETAYTVTWPSGLTWLDGEPALEAGKSYRFALRCEPNGTIIGNLAYEYTA